MGTRRLHLLADMSGVGASVGAGHMAGEGRGGEPAMLVWAV